MADIRPILDLIGRHEADGATAAQRVASPYDVVWGGLPVAHRPQALVGRPLTALTIAEVIDWQRDVVARGGASSACGRYQFIRATLTGLVTLEGASRAARFDAAVQDQFAARLVNDRGWPRVVSGAMDPRDFADALAREWASLPVQRDQQGATRPVMRGQSYYAGDGLNRAGAGPEAVMAAIVAALGRAPEPPTPPGEDVRAELAALRRRVASLEAFRAAVASASQGIPAVDTSA